MEVIRLDDYRRDPVREYKKEIFTAKKKISQADAWLKTGKRITDIQRHLEEGGDIGTAIEALMEVIGRCYAYHGQIST